MLEKRVTCTPKWPKGEEGKGTRVELNCCPGTDVIGDFDLFAANEVWSAAAEEAAAEAAAVTDGN